MYQCNLLGKIPPQEVTRWFCYVGDKCGVGVSSVVTALIFLVFLVGFWDIKI